MVDPTTWGFPSILGTQSTPSSTNVVSYAFGDTDGDGDVDMVGVTCYEIDDTNLGEYCKARLKFYENVQASVTPGTPPSFEVRNANFATGKMTSELAALNLNFWPRFGGMIALVDYDLAAAAAAAVSSLWLLKRTIFLIIDTTCGTVMTILLQYCS